MFAVVEQSKHFMIKLHSMSELSTKNKQCRQGFKISIIVLEFILLALFIESITINILYEWF